MTESFLNDHDEGKDTRHRSYLIFKDFLSDVRTDSKAHKPHSICDHLHELAQLV